MNCKEFEKQIPGFLAGKLDFMALKQFQDHRNHCDNCREELEIQFLVTEGIQHLEEGDAFDLQNELYYQLKNAERKVKINIQFMKAGMVMQVLAGILLAGVIVWILAGGKWFI